MAKSKFKVPNIDFGAELEFSFALRRSTYNEYHGIDERKREARYGGESAPSVSGPKDYPVGERGSIGNDSEEGEIENSRSSPSIATTLETYSPGVQLRLRQYLLALLNRNLISSPQRPSLLGGIKASEPHQGDSESWTLTHDATVNPRRNQFAKLQGLSTEDTRLKYWVGGAELVSPVLDYEKFGYWEALFQQIEDDLKGDKNHSVFFNDSEGLHIHLSIRDEDIGLETVMNLIVLYGLFDTQIERWLGVDRRHDIQWCRRVRVGMERLQNTRYTPQAFTEAIYNAKTLDEMRALVSGEEVILNAQTQKEVQVYVSPERKDKKVTLEFRQHQGTVETTVITWWVKFCATLLKTARFLAQTGMRLFDTPGCGTSFLEGLLEEDILDLLSFPEEGRRFFKDRAIKLDDLGHNARRELEEVMIQERIKRRWKGEAILGYKSDLIIKKEAHFLRAKKLLESKYNLEIMLVDDEYEFHKDFPEERPEDWDDAWV